METITKRGFAILAVVVTAVIMATGWTVRSNAQTQASLQLQVQAQRAQIEMLHRAMPKPVSACDAPMDYIDVKWQKAYCAQLQRGFNTRTGEWN